MLKTYRLGRLFGFPIEVNLTFLLMLAAVLLWMGGLAGVFVVSVAFASVIAHELGHAVVARRLGIRIAGIELHFFGGAAKMLDQPRSARDEILIALAGPAVSVVLAGLGWATFAVTGVEFFRLFGLINSVIAVFNLLPALPMDGGRVLRAALTYKLPFTKATRVSITVARVLTVGLAVLALSLGHITLFLLSIALWFMGSAELRMASIGYSGDTVRWPRNASNPPSVHPLDLFFGQGPSHRRFEHRSEDETSNRSGPRFRLRRAGRRIVIEPVD